MSEAVLTINNLSKKFCRSLRRSLMYGVKDIAKEILLTKGRSQTKLRRDEFWALKDISFELYRGETLSLVGHNGAGKTTLLKLINGLIKPDVGTIDVRGTIGALIAVGPGFNPILTGRENIYVSGSILGLSKREIDKRFQEIVDFAEIGEFIDAPVKSYSSGMLSRLGFAVASTLNPDILLIDEVLSVGDSSFRQRCITRLNEYKRNGGSIIFVSHNSVAVEAVSDRAILLDRGKVVEIGAPDRIIQIYEQHALKIALNHQLSAQNGYRTSPDDDILITAVECFNLNGEHHRQYAFHQSFEIRISYQLIHPVDYLNAVIAFSAENYPDCLISKVSMGWSGLQVNPVNQTGMIRCQLNHPQFTPGNWSIHIGFQGLTSGSFGKKWHREMRKDGCFTILPGNLKQILPGINANLLVSMPSPMYVDCRWQVMENNSDEIDEIYQQINCGNLNK